MNPLKSRSSMLVFFGMLLLFAAGRFSRMAHEAPGDSRPGLCSIMEFSTGLPAIVFTIAGAVAIVAAVAILVMDDK